MSIILDGTTGITTPGLTNTGTETLVNLTTTGNTTLGDASTDTLNVGNGGLIKDASGNVGIGTSSPADRFDVRFASGTGSVRFGVISNNNVKIYNTTGDIRLASSDASSDVSLDSQRNVIFNTANAERMRLDSSGNLGLGVTPSAWSSGKVLEIGNTGNSVWGNSTANFYLTENTYYNGGWKYASSNGAATYQMLTNSHIWSIAPSGTAGNAITFTQAMTLDASGNLGIGTTSPTQKITANGSIRLTGNSSNFNETGAQMDAYDGLRLASYISTGSAIQFLTNASGGNTAERARIDSSGKFGIGNTNPQARLDLGSSYGADGEKFFIYNDNNTSALAGTKMGFYIDRFSESNSLTLVFPYASGTSSRFHVAYKNTAGTTITDVCYVTNTSTSWTFPSDERLKDIVAPVTGALDILKNIRTVYYTLKRDSEKRRKIGMLAQDWLATVPEVVDVPKVEFDFEKAQGHLSLASTDTIPVLVAAINEQQAIIESLKARLDAANI